MQALLGHPYVLYEAGPDAWGRTCIHCICRACGAEQHRSCPDPGKTGYWVNHFANQHWHGRPGGLQGCCGG